MPRVTFADLAPIGGPETEGGMGEVAFGGDSFTTGFDPDADTEIEAAADDAGDSSPEDDSTESDARTEITPEDLAAVEGDDETADDDTEEEETDETTEPELEAKAEAETVADTKDVAKLRKLAKYGASVKAQIADVEHVLPDAVAITKAFVTEDFDPVAFAKTLRKVDNPNAQAFIDALFQGHGDHWVAGQLGLPAETTIKDLRSLLDAAQKQNVLPTEPVTLDPDLEREVADLPEPAKAAIAKMQAELGKWRAYGRATREESDRRQAETAKQERVKQVQTQQERVTSFDGEIRKMAEQVVTERGIKPGKDPAKRDDPLNVRYRDKVNLILADLSDRARGDKATGEAINKAMQVYVENREGLKNQKMPGIAAMLRDALESRLKIERAVAKPPAGDKKETGKVESKPGAKKPGTPKHVKGKGAASGRGQTKSGWDPDPKVRMANMQRNLEAQGF